MAAIPPWSPRLEDLVDLLFSRIGGAPVELVIDGDEAERAAALAIATSGIHRECQFSDVASDRSTERLRQLSDEVSRIASTLARLSTGPGERQRPAPVAAGAEVPPVSATRCAQSSARGDCAAVLRGRAVRRSCLGHAARPAPGGDCTAPRAGFQPVHRRRGPRDDGASLAQDDDRQGHLPAPRGSARRPPRVRRAVASERARRCAAYFAEVGRPPAA